MGAAWLIPVLVFVGAGSGALLRWALALWFNPPTPGWPWGTLLANLLGGFLVGMALLGFSSANPLAWDETQTRAAKALLVTGFLGGLTTFSTFSAEVVDLAGQGRWSAAASWAGLHLLGSLALTVTGLALARLLWTGAQA